MSAQGQKLDLVTVENLQEQDLAEADHIFRVAFGTFIGVPDPASFYQAPTTYARAGLPIRPLLLRQGFRE